MEDIRNPCTSCGLEVRMRQEFRRARLKIFRYINKNSPMPKCCVPGCLNRGSVAFPNLAKDAVLRAKWIQAVRQGSREEKHKLWQPAPYSVVCHSHFTATDYTTETSLGTKPTYRRRKPDAVPSVFQWTSGLNGNDRKEKLLSRNKKNIAVFKKNKRQWHSQPVVSSACSDDRGPSSICTYQPASTTACKSQRPIFLKGAPVQQAVYFLLPNQGSVEKTSDEKTAAQIKYDLAQKEIATLQQKLEKLQKQIVGKKWSVDRIKFNDEKTRFYTGLPSWSAFMSLFSIVEQDVTEVKCEYHDPMDTDDQYDLTLSDELFAVLVTFKLGLYREEVADCFAIKLEKFDKIFSVWVSCLYNKLEQWGTRMSTLKKVVDRVVPSFVQNTSNLKIILCWLKLTFKLSSSPNREVKESVYKVLTGLNPQGSFIFSSGIWVLKAEGSMVAVTSGILEFLDDGDTIIVPSDIDIDYAVQSKSIKSITLPYDKGEVIRTADEQTQSIYRFIQQSIDRLKGFKIMDKIIPVELLENSHKLVSVCSRLCNCHNS
ncbi:hypothetical protein ScPMuIL_010600 [Solemya velum]